MEAKIILIYETPKEAKAISEAVSPDNIKTPDNITVQTMSTDTRVLTSIKYGGDNLKTFLSTIDDLLSCVSIAEKAFSAVKRFKTNRPNS